MLLGWWLYVPAPEVSDVAPGWRICQTPYGYGIILARPPLPVRGCADTYRTRQDAARASWTYTHHLEPPQMVDVILGLVLVLVAPAAIVSVLMIASMRRRR